MRLLLAAVAVLAGSGLAAWACGARPRLSRGFGVGGALFGAALVLAELSRGLGTVVFSRPWPLPGGSFSLRWDPLGAVFAFAIAVVTALAAVFGGGYLPAAAPRRNLGGAWFFYNLLTASMILVVLAADAFVFLLAWEAMSLASFFLVMFESEHRETRAAGWTYLVAVHLGGAFLLMLFGLMAAASGSLDFRAFAASGGVRALGGVLFVLAVIGFGAKAGFVPLHVWLPEAHPAAPAHVSAVMSGVMIKTGIYGILRILTLLGPPPAWWGWTLIAVGAVSGILGVIFALAQHDLKRLLAYHSVENVGIITLGLGTGLLGVSYGNPVMAVLGLAGGLFHVVNHALFKSLLFLGAGAVAAAAGTREIDSLGGLGKRMPVTAAAFLIGAAAISGLPPLNGFASEFFIYLGIWAGSVRPSPAPVSLAIGGPLALAALALIGGLAAACFAKAFGVIFLGQPRRSLPEGLRDPSPALLLPMLILAAACLALGLLAPVALGLLLPALGVVLAGVSGPSPEAGAVFIRPALVSVSAAGAGFLGLLVLLAWARRGLLRRRRVRAGSTWDCGYAASDPRMQYTGSSFAEPIVEVFRYFIRPRARLEAPQGLFPEGAGLHSETPDLFRDKLFAPLFGFLNELALKLRWLQQGRVQLYVLYIAVTVLALLIWKLG